MQDYKKQLLEEAKKDPDLLDDLFSSKCGKPAPKPLVKEPQWVKAGNVHCKPTFFGLGKWSVQCGHCKKVTLDTKKVVVVTNKDNRIAVFCNHCGTWNLTEYVRKKDEGSNP